VILLDDRIRGYSADDQEVLSAVLWAYLRSRLQASDNLTSLRAWVRDGDKVLQAVEEALETTFTSTVLQELIDQGRQFAATESAGGSDFQRARNEVHQLDAEEVLPIILVGGFLMGYGPAALYCDTYGC